jgi:hypothetical protein
MFASLVLQFVTQKRRGAFGCNPAIHKYRHNINVPSLSEEWVQPPCLVAPTLEIVPKQWNRKTRKMWRSYRIRAILQLSTNSTERTLFKYPRPTDVCSAIAEVYPFIKCKWLSSTSLIPPGVHFGSATNTFSNYIWVVLVPWQSSAPKQHWEACLRDDCCAV